MHKYLATIGAEAEAIRLLFDFPHDKVKDFIDLLVEAQGVIRVVGVGKSALIAQKFADTMACIGYVVEFNTAEELNHGGLGKIQALDLIVLVSKSGNTQELSPILDFCCANRVGFVCVMCDTNDPEMSNGRSGYVRANKFAWACANYMGYLISLPCPKEADTYDLIPTSSYAMMNAFFDGVCMEMMGEIEKENITINHPGGTFGKTSRR